MSKEIKLASIAVIRHPFHQSERILVSRRISPDIPEEDGLWQLCGGGVNFGEDPVDTLVREVEEETNLPIELQSPRPFIISMIMPGGAHGLMFVYECLAGIHDIPPNPEPECHTDWEWMSIEMAATLPKFLAFDELFKRRYFP